MQTRSKGCIFSIALHKISWKYLNLPWQENLYKFLYLCFDPVPAPDHDITGSSGSGVSYPKYKK